MPTENPENMEGTPEKKKSGKKIVIGVIIVLLLSIGGGVFAYMNFNAKDDEKKETSKEEKVTEAIFDFPLDPFVVNLTDANASRYLKATFHLGLVNKDAEGELKPRTAQIRDAIITILSSQDAKFISSAEGQFQLKDDIAIRINQIINKDIVKSVYLTEFIMQ